MASVATSLGLKYIQENIGIHETNMDTIEETISRLKFISHIEVGEKINVKTLTRQSNSIGTTISRTLLYPDNRVNTMNFIRNVINRVFDIIDHNLRKNNKVLVKRIINDLVLSKKGLLNLKLTYETDTKFGCDIEVFIEKVANFISDLEVKCPELFIEAVPPPPPDDS